MKKYIVVDDRFKTGQYLLGIAQSLMAVDKSVDIISEEEFAVSPSEGTPYNDETQKAIKTNKSYKIDSIDELFDSI